MYGTINYNMYTICIRNTARSKLIPLLCTHLYSYMFSIVHPPRIEVPNWEIDDNKAREDEVRLECDISPTPNATNLSLEEPRIVMWLHG